MTNAFWQSLRNFYQKINFWKSQNFDFFQKVGKIKIKKKQQNLVPKNMKYHEKIQNFPKW